MATTTYVHAWGGPHVIGFTDKDGLPKDILWTARQRCERCETERNPLTGSITKYRGRKDEETGLHPCQLDVEELPRDPWKKQTERVRQDLLALRAEGRRVSFRHPDEPDTDQGRLV